jgi:hypothetical protein
MHALPILHRCLTPLLSHIHARRLGRLFEAVVSCVRGPAALRHKIKRADRLLGNRQPPCAGSCWRVSPSP